MPLLARHGALRVPALTFSMPVIPSSRFALRAFSVINRPQPNYPGHVPLTFVERGALAVGSAVGSLLNPRRGGTIHPRLSHIDPKSMAN